MFEEQFPTVQYLRVDSAGSISFKVTSTAGFLGAAAHKRGCGGKRAGGSLHTLPFLVPNLHIALTLAYVVVAVELVLIAAIRHRFFGTSWWLSILQVVGGGALVFAAALFFGNA